MRKYCFVNNSTSIHQMGIPQICLSFHIWNILDILWILWSEVFLSPRCRPVHNRHWLSIPLYFCWRSLWSNPHEKWSHSHSTLECDTNVHLREASYLWLFYWHLWCKGSFQSCLFVPCGDAQIWGSLLCGKFEQCYTNIDLTNPLLP